MILRVLLPPLVSVKRRVAGPRFGRRPQRRASKASEPARPGEHYVLDADIRDYFESIDHTS